MTPRDYLLGSKILRWFSRAGQALCVPLRAVAGWVLGWLEWESWKEDLERRPAYAVSLFLFSAVLSNLAVLVLLHQKVEVQGVLFRIALCLVALIGFRDRSDAETLAKTSVVLKTIRWIFRWKRN